MDLRETRSDNDVDLVNSQFKELSESLKIYHENSEILFQQNKRIQASINILVNRLGRFLAIEKAREEEAEEIADELAETTSKEGLLDEGDK